MLPLEQSADEIVRAALSYSKNSQVAILDSCGIEHFGANRLFVGLQPVKTLEIPLSLTNILEHFETELNVPGWFAFFTLSYDLGRQLQLPAKDLSAASANSGEPAAHISFFDQVILHDYKIGKGFLLGNEKRFAETLEILDQAVTSDLLVNSASSSIKYSVTKKDYISAIERIKEYIRRGDTYQVNLTQQLAVELAGGVDAQNIFWRARSEHPMPFSAFIKRPDSAVVSASPECLVRVEGDDVVAAPIKGTRKRGLDKGDDMRLLDELLASEKDRAENIMIVDLLRNDLGRFCEFGSVKVEKLCAPEEHRTLFHLVSLIRGTKRVDSGFADIVRAVFPCGSITGAPKIRTMEIIDELEPCARGLSMGSVGINIPFGIKGIGPVFQMNVAIRTLVVRGAEALFNVGGGIVIDSDPDEEYAESLLKAKALLNSIGIDP